ncbi:MAG: AAA family ATPase [Gammaproteobacteria bacterium]|nr:AAA family ATPase [Pseudomonadales bacterium]
MNNASRDEISDDAVKIQLNVLVLAISTQTAADLEKALGHIRSLQYRITKPEISRPLRENLSGRAGEMPDVVILEIDGHKEEALEDIRRFVEEFGQQTEVFATFPRSELAMMPALMRSGVRDVLPLPLSQQDLVVALTNSLARHRKSLHRARDNKGAVVSFLNTRSGAGGPFVAANLAYSLQFEFERKVALIDLDIQFGTVAYDFDIKSDGGIVEALRSPGRIDSVFVEALMSRHSSGVDVLASPADLTPWDGLSDRALTRLISVLTQKYDHVVINLPVLINDVVEQALALSNPVYLVTQGTISMLRNLNMVLHRLPKRGIPLQNIEIILNRAGSLDKDIKNVDLEKLIRDLPLHRVRSDFKLVMKAENEGKAACELESRAGLVKDIRSIAEHLLSYDKDYEADDKQVKRRWFS